MSRGELVRAGRVTLYRHNSTLDQVGIRAGQHGYERDEDAGSRNGGRNDEVQTGLGDLRQWILQA